MKNQLLTFIIASIVLWSCTKPQPEDKNISVEKTRHEMLWIDADRLFILNELERTTNELVTETEHLTEEQASFRENLDRWSITEIIEHLEVQNELHYREIRAISKTPQLPKYESVVRGNDNYFKEYATDTTKGRAQWFLEPIGRFCSKSDALEAFLRVRKHFTAYIKETDVDLRKHFTFRNNIEGKDESEIKVGDVRDLHQLLLTGIAHTDRHLTQIRRIKRHKDYPK